jgi:DNA anti-recombination protein RmuC
MVLSHLQEIYNWVFFMNIMHAPETATSEEWIESLRKLKEVTEHKIRESRRTEEQVREKYQGEAQHILDIIRPHLNAVVEIFQDPSKDDLDQPQHTIDESVNAANLSPNRVC